MSASAPNSKPRKIKSIAVAVVRDGDRFLVGQRPEGVPLAGYAEFPGGKIEPDEPPEAAAVRECLEETGLEIEIAGSLAVVEHEYAHGTLRLHFFSAEVASSSLEAAKSPQGSFRWATGNELSSLRFPPANDVILQILCDPSG